MMAMAAGPRRGFGPAPAPVRRCACGRPVGPGGECAECARRRREQASSATPGTAAGHAFAGLALHDGRPREEGEKKPPAKPKDTPAPKPKPEAAAKKCSPTWYGSTDPEVTPDGRFTGKLVITYNDAAIKSPCVRECVRKHEEVHVRDLTPLMQRIAACDRAAGNDWDKRGACNVMALEMGKLVDRTECNAYAVSIDCLKAMLADPKGKCGKGKDRKEVQAHLAREECHLRESCAAAKGKK